MLCKIKTSKKRILKTILTDFSRKEKTITRYTRIYQKLNGRDNTKQAKSFIFIVVSLCLSLSLSVSLSLSLSLSKKKKKKKEKRKKIEM